MLSQNSSKSNQKVESSLHNTTAALRRTIKRCSLSSAAMQVKRLRDSFLHHDNFGKGLPAALEVQKKENQMQMLSALVQKEKKHLYKSILVEEDLYAQQEVAVSVT